MYRRRFLFTPICLLLLCCCLANEATGDPVKGGSNVTGGSNTRAKLTSAEALHEEGEVMILFFAAILSVFMETYIHSKHWTFIPEGVSAMVIGVIIGLVYSYVSEDAKNEYSTSTTALSTWSFQMFLLPPIIFDAGFSLRKKGFIRSLGSITSYAFLGTFISTMFIGSMVYLYIFYVTEKDVVDKMKPSRMFFESMTYGALISAVDPIGSLAILGNVFGIEKHSNRQNPLLYNLVFGESVLNDAVAIVLFRSFRNFIEVELEPGSIAYIFLTFIGVFAASLAIGTVIATITCLLFRFTNIKSNSSYEIVVVFFMSYASFVVCETVHLSGIVAIFACGVVQAHYTYYNLSTMGQIILPRIFSALANLAETVVFVYLGMATFAFKHKWNVGFSFFVVAVCGVARALAVFPTTCLINCRRKRNITCKEATIIWFSGIRGAIAFVLAIELTEIEKAKHSEMFLTTTLLMIYITTIVCGGFTEPLLKFLGVMDVADPNAIDEDEEDHKQDVTEAEVQEASSLKSEGDLRVVKFKAFDNRFIKPFLLGDGGRRRGTKMINSPSANDSKTEFLELHAVDTEQENKEAVDLQGNPTSSQLQV